MIYFTSILLSAIFLIFIVFFRSLSRSRCRLLCSNFIFIYVFIKCWFYIKLKLHSYWFFLIWFFTWTLFIIWQFCGTFVFL